MARIFVAVSSVTLVLLLAAGNALAHGGGGGGGGGGHGGGFGGGGFGGGGFGGGGFGGGGFGGGGFGGGHSGGFSSGGFGGGFGGMHAGGGYSGATGGYHTGGAPLGGMRANTGGLSQTGGLHSGALGRQSTGFVNNHVASGFQTANRSGSFNSLSHHNPAYWQNRSYFLGSASPFGNYLGYPWWGGRYGNRFAYFPFFGFGLGYGIGYGFGGYGYGYPYYNYQSTYPYGYYGANTSAVAMQNGGAPPADQLQNSLDYAGQGEIEFKQGKYQAAVRSWRHALVDDPRNGAIVLLLSQALFAAGQYDESAGATQAALSLLPQDKWGTVVTHYKELYPNMQDYTNQIRALEKARDAKPDDAAIHFLLGYHFGYLGYAKHAVKELDKTLTLAPKDDLAKKLREEFASKVDNADKPGKADDKPSDKDKPDDGTEA